MSDTTGAGMSRRKLLQATGTAAAVAAVGLAGASGAAQQPPMFRQTPFNPDLAGLVERAGLPLNPPIETWKLSTKGEVAPFGPFVFTAQLIARMGVDGKPLSLTDGVGAFTGPNGDALFFTVTGLFRTPDPATPEVFPFDAAVIFTGGAGRFAGAYGSGHIRGEANPAKSQFVGLWYGISVLYLA